MSISASQIRAARGLLGLTQAEFAAAANVNQRTVIAVERGENLPSHGTILRLESAFRWLGVKLIPEGEGRGPGVRLAEPEGGATIIRKDLLKGGEEIGVVVCFGGKTITARVAVAALAPDGDTDAALAAFNIHRIAIGNAIAGKLAAQACDADGHVRISAADFRSAEHGDAA